MRTTDPARIEPVFLVCCERSGSTLLRHMLDHHPDLAWNGGFTFAVDRIGEDGAFPALEDYYRFLEVNRVFQTAGFRIDRSLGYRDLVYDFLRQERHRAGKSIVGANVYRHFDRLAALFPSGRFIHLLRDGRDVSRSWTEMGWAGNAWCAAERWDTAERCWERVREGLPPERRLEVRYESLIAEPEQTLRRICEFIGVSYSPRMLAYPDDTGYAPPDDALVGQWRGRLRPLEIRLLEARLGSLLSARGYPLSGLAPLRVGPVQRLGLRVHDRCARLRARIRADGPGLVIADALARRLGPGSWQRRIQRRLNANEVKRLE